MPHSYLPTFKLKKEETYEKCKLRSIPSGILMDVFHFLIDHVAVGLNLVTL